MGAPMIRSKSKTQKPRKAAAHIWAELADICRKIRVRLYGRNQNKRLARRYQHRLELIMKQLPENDLAIIRQEGAALLSELKNDYDSAIQYRKKEIQLTERAQNSVQESVDREDYDARTAVEILHGRDYKEPEERHPILRALEQQMDSRPNRNGLNKFGRRA